VEMLQFPRSPHFRGVLAFAGSCLFCLSLTAWAFFRSGPVPQAATVVNPNLASPPLVRTVGDDIAESARKLVGRKSLHSATEEMRDDCIGFVRYVYATAKIEVLEAAKHRWSAGNDHENAANALFLGARQMGLLRQRYPIRGDLVFFKETYDVNRDGLRNDGVTHVGIVDEVLPGGTVSFVHREARGIVVSRATPTKAKQIEGPDGTVLNDFIRRGTLEHRGYTAGELVAGFVSPIDLRAIPPAGSKQVALHRSQPSN
jgi:hypothetical protein